MKSVGTNIFYLQNMNFNLSKTFNSYFQRIDLKPHIAYVKEALANTNPVSKVKLFCYCYWRQLFGCFVDLSVSEVVSE